MALHGQTSVARSRLCVDPHCRRTVVASHGRGGGPNSRRDALTLPRAGVSPATRANAGAARRTVATVRRAALSSRRRRAARSRRGHDLAAGVLTPAKTVSPRRERAYLPPRARIRVLCVDPRRRRTVATMRRLPPAVALNGRGGTMTSRRGAYLPPGCSHPAASGRIPRHEREYGCGADRCGATRPRSPPSGRTARRARDRRPAARDARRTSR